MYRPPDEDIIVFKKFCENLLSQMIKNRKKKKIIAGDLNINVLDYEFYKNVQHFLSSMF